MTINELKQLVENLKARNIPTSIATVENENPYTLLGKINIVIANLEEILKMTEDLSTNKLSASKQAVIDVGGLVTPPVAPTSNKLVGINTTGAQEQIGIGTGLSIENNVLSASGGGSKLYRHVILAKNSKTDYASCEIITSSQTVFTKSTFANWLNTNGFNSGIINSSKNLVCCGSAKLENTNEIIIRNGIYSTNGVDIYSSGIKLKITLENNALVYSVTSGVTAGFLIDTFSDTVNEL